MDEKTKREKKTYDEDNARIDCWMDKYEISEIKF